MRDERQDHRFYRPAMAPSFVDSKRRARLGLGFNLGGCCAHVADVKNAARIAPNPLFSRSDSVMRIIHQHSPPRPPPRIVQQQMSPARIVQQQPPPMSPPRIVKEQERLPLVAILDDDSCSSDSWPLSSASSDSSMDLRAEREVRWKGVNLPFYDGKWDADAIDEWLGKMDAFFKICGKSMSEQEKIHCAVFHLTGKAHKWWRAIAGSCPKNTKSRSKKDQSKISHSNPSKIHQEGAIEAPARAIRSWKELKAEIVKFFMPCDRRNERGDWSMLLRRLQRMKQECGVTLRDYDQQFLELYVDVLALKLPASDVVLAYVDGLRDKRLSHMLSHVVWSHNVSLQVAMRLASMFEGKPATVCPWCSTPLPS